MPHRSRPSPRVVAAAGLLAVLLAAAGCARTPPEDALRARIGELQQAIESREPSAIADVLAEDFIGEGSLDRDGARRLATLQFMRRDSVGVALGPLEVQMHGDDRATVRTTAVLAGGASRLLPDGARVYRVDSGWRVVDGEWQLASARWSGEP